MDPNKAPANTYFSYSNAWMPSPTIRGFALPSVNPILPRPDPITNNRYLPHINPFKKQ